MNRSAFRAGRASRQNDWRGVKTRLYLKFFGGPKLGLLFSSREQLTGDVDEAIEHVLRVLKKIGLETPRDALVIKLRRFDEDAPFADGIFAAPEALGYLLYAPPDMSRAEVTNFMIDYLDLVALYRTECDGDPSRLFTGPVLPRFPELPEPVTVLWSAEDGIVPVFHGH